MFGLALLPVRAEATAETADTAGHCVILTVRPGRRAAQAFAP